MTVQVCSGWSGIVSGQRRLQPEGEFRPIDLVVPDQFFDRTKGGSARFFGAVLVAHVGVRASRVLKRSCEKCRRFGSRAVGPK
jgi:purine nucleoside phosphorylase